MAAASFDKVVDLVEVLDIPSVGERAVKSSPELVGRIGGVESPPASVGMISPPFEPLLGILEWRIVNVQV